MTWLLNALGLKAGPLIAVAVLAVAAGGWIALGEVQKAKRAARIVELQAVVQARDRALDNATAANRSMVEALAAQRAEAQRAGESAAAALAEARAHAVRANTLRETVTHVIRTKPDPRVCPVAPSVAAALDGLWGEPAR